MAGPVEEGRGGAAAADASPQRGGSEESSADRDQAAAASAHSSSAASAQLADGELPKALQCRLRGIVKAYQPAKGYGFIDCSQTRPFFKNDVFLHKFEAERAGAVQPGTLVSFRLRLCPAGKPQADSVVVDRGPPPAAATAGAAARVGPPGFAAVGASPLQWAAPVVDERSYMGHIKSYNDENGFGFIECGELKERYGRDVFLHRSQKGGFAVGDAVRFRIDVDYKGFPKAKNVLAGSLVRRVGGGEGQQAAVRGASGHSDGDEAPPPPPPRPVPRRSDSPQDDVPPPPPPLSSNKSAQHPPPPPPPPVEAVTKFPASAYTEVAQDESIEEDMVRSRENGGGGGGGSQVRDDDIGRGAERGAEDEVKKKQEEEEKGEGQAAQNSQEKEQLKRRESGRSKDGEKEDEVTRAVLRIQCAARAALARRLTAAKLAADVTKIQFEPDKVHETEESTTATSEEASCQQWQRYLASSETGFWWWHESTGDWFMEKDPGPWQRFSDPTSGDFYWWKDDESWFWEAAGCH